MRRVVPLCEAFMGALRSGASICADHTHWIPSRVLVEDPHVGSWSEFTPALFAIANERAQALSYAWTRTTSGEEVLPLAKEVAERHADAGIAPPAVAFTDRCCDSVRLIRSILGSPSPSYPSLITALLMFIRMLPGFRRPSMVVSLYGVTCTIFSKGIG